MLPELTISKVCFADHLKGQFVSVLSMANKKQTDTLTGNFSKFEDSAFGGEYRQIEENPLLFSLARGTDFAFFAAFESVNKRSFTASHRG